MASSERVSSDDEYVLLRNALREKDIETVNKLLFNNASVNRSKIVPLNTPLQWAIRNYTDTKFVEILLKKGADIHVENPQGATPLQIAAEYSRVDIIRLHLTKSKNINEDLESEINKTVYRKESKALASLMNYIVEARITVNLTNGIGIAAMYGYLDDLKCLLHHHKPDNQTIQHISINVFNNGEKSDEIFWLLYTNGFTISPQDNKSFEYIYAIVKAKCSKIAKYILSKVDDINEINKFTGYTLLHVACLNTDAEMIQLLINCKANLDTKVSVRTQIEKYSSESKLHKLFFNKTALFIAVYNSAINLVKILLENDASIKEEPDIVITAIQKSSKEIVEILLQYGADINAVDTSGKNSLHYIIKTNKESDLYEKFTYDSFPRFTLKDDNSYTKMLDLFLRNGGNPNNNHANSSPLQVAIAEGNLTAVKLLLKYKADINYSNLEGNTPTHFAANGDLNILNTILKYNPNIHVVNKRLMSPVDVANVKQNFNAAVQLLIKDCPKYIPSWKPKGRYRKI